MHHANGVAKEGLVYRAGTQKQTQEGLPWFRVLQGHIRELDHVSPPLQCPLL